MFTSSRCKVSRGKYTRKVRNVVFFFSNLNLPHSAVKCPWKLPTSPSGVLVLEFDGDGFHFGVFSQCIFT